MQCQLGRIVKGEVDVHHLGKLVWVVSGPPEDMIFYDYTKGPASLSTKTYPHFELCYFDTTHTDLITIHAKNIELLPYFKEREPTSWDEWLGEGGESIPDEKTETAV